MNSRRTTILLAVVCVLVASLAISVGPVGWRLPWPPDDMLLGLRAPRVLLAGIVGASLALAGVSMQGLLHNDLADPYILGLSGGASTGAVLSLALWPGLPPGPAAAAGAAAAAVVVRSLSRGPYNPTKLLLAGVAVSSILGSVTGLVLILAPADRLLRSTTFWLFGGLGTPRWSALILPTFLLVVIGSYLFRRTAQMDRLSLGQDVAASLGVEISKTRRGMFIATVTLTAVAVAVGGLIGFVGLIAPHAARLFVGLGHRRVLPVAALGGAILVIAADAVARTAFSPRELPVGLLTAAVGGPFFLSQLQRDVQ